MKDAVVRKALRFFGSVQGVGFRYRAVHAARRVGATGWVRNEWDGSVSMEIQGSEAQIDRVLEMIGRGTFVRVEWMEARSLPVLSEERGFEALDDD